MTSQAGAGGVHVTPPSGGGAAALPPGYLDGFGVSRTSGTVIGIKAGACRDSTNTVDLSAGVLSANIAASGANGLDTGSAANSTWYSVWIIGGGGNPVASLLSTSTTVGGLTLPGTYTVARRIAWTRRATGAWMQWDQIVGEGRVRWFMYDNEDSTDTGTNGVQVLTGGQSTSWTDVDCSGVTPPQTNNAPLIMITIKGDGDDVADVIGVRPKGSTESNSVNNCWMGTTASFQQSSGSVTTWIRTDANGEIQYVDANTAFGAWIWVLGYADEL